MTALIYSLALGFLMFLSITCRMQMEVNSLENLKYEAGYLTFRTLQKHTFDIGATE